MKTDHRVPVSGTKGAISQAKDFPLASASAGQLDQLRESEERFRNAFDHAAVGMFMQGLDLRWLRVNKALCEIVGYSEEELLASTFPAITHSDDLDADLVAVKKFLDGEISSYYREKRYVHKSGRSVWVQLSVSLIRDEGGRPLYFVGHVQDIDGRKRLEQEFARDALLLANVSDSVIVTDADGLVSYWNEGATRLYGWTAEEMLGRPLAEMFPDPDARNFVAMHLRRLFEEGTEWCGEWEAYRKDGSRLWIYCHVRRFCDPQGKPVGVLGISHDITDKKRLEERFLQAQKMEAIGRLAGGVAHDFNNLLTVINGHSSNLLDALPEHDQLRPIVEEINKAGERAAGLTAQLLAYSRQQILQPKVLDLNALIADIHKMLARLIGEDVALVTSLAPDLTRIKADKGQLEQVLVNLSVNARDAMPQGGRLTVETANVTLDSVAVGEQADVPPGAYVLLAISDTGTGMDKETQARIFEPFFTTKEQGKGTGLGLAMVYGFVKSSGGHVRVYSEVGLGTTFKLYFPTLPDAKKEGEKQSRAVKILGGTETVLLVEDEAGVRKLTQFLLERLGYRVLTAEDGEEALKIAAEHAGRIDLLITDVVMPGLSGPQVAEALRTRCPHVKVLYLSGYTDDAVFRHGVLEAETAFLQKPFTNVALATKVRKVLGKNG